MVASENLLPTTPAKVWSLDDLLVEYCLPVRELVKIDAEGFDRKVLRGAKTLLGKPDVFLLVGCSPLLEFSLLYSCEIQNIVLYDHRHGRTSFCG